MSSDVVANPPASSVESKSARKKKAKAEAAAAASTIAAGPATPSSETQLPAHETKINGAESENLYIRELQRGIRNVNKKLNLMSKVDSIIAENPGIALDELVTSKKINADQKAQALKKPQLQAQLAQYEEQLVQYKKIDQEYQNKVEQEKELLQSNHKKELEQLRDTLKAEAIAEEKKNIKQGYLTLSKFLHQAAAKRQSDEPDSEERHAFEGVLLLVYGGDSNAVEAIEKLVDGSSDIVDNVEGTPTGVPYSQIREVALAGGPYEVAQFPTEQATTNETDPTIAHAGLTELDAGTATDIGSQHVVEEQGIPAAARTGAEAANIAADKQWDQATMLGEDPMAESYEMVPRDPAETENTVAPVAVNSTQSWADDTPADVPGASANAAPASGDDGFKEVPNRGGRARGDGRGHFQGRGRGGDRGRGRGRGRGDGRGRGRGEHRGRPRGGDAQGPPPS